MARTPTKAAASDAATEGTVRRSVQVPGQDIQPAGAKWGQWSVFSHAEHTWDDACDPRYLWAKADQIRPGDEITIKHPYGNWVLILDVVSVDKVLQGIVSNIRSVFDYTQEGAKKIAPDLSTARVEYLGARGWAVVQGHHVAKDSMTTREEADAWLIKRRGA